MKLNSNYTGTFSDKTGKHFFYLEVPVSAIDELNKFKECTVEIKRRTKKRTYTQNSALWALLSEMAFKLNTTDTELYTEMLIRYGVSDFLVVKPEAIDMVKRQFKACEDLGEVKVNDSIGRQLKVYHGSSTYDKQQFARLLDGIISEAKEVNVYLITDAIRNSVINNMEVKI